MTETLPEFLLARFAERAAAIEYAYAEARFAFPVLSPAEMLADVEAKRRIVNWAAPISSDYERIPTDRPGVYDTRPLRYVSDDGHDLLCILALPYADHPDYREEWKA